MFCRQLKQAAACDLQPTKLFKTSRIETPESRLAGESRPRFVLCMLISHYQKRQQASLPDDRNVSITDVIAEVQGSEVHDAISLLVNLRECLKLGLGARSGPEQVGVVLGCVTIMAPTDKLCCLGTVKQGELKGKNVTLGPLTTYVTGNTNTGAQAILAVPDIYGFGIPNTR